MYEQLMRRVRHVVNTPYKLTDEDVTQAIESARASYVLPEQHRRQIVLAAADMLSRADTMTP